VADNLSEALEDDVIVASDKLRFSPETRSDKRAGTSTVIPATPPASQETSNNTIVSVQILRGIAALLVVFHHYIGTAMEKGFAIAGLSGIAIGNVGVDIFFVISGFIMEYVTGTKKYLPGDRYAFMANRMQRILPLYWILTIAAFSAFLLLQDAVNSKSSIHQFFMSMLVLPEFSTGGGAYVIPMAWTLTYEFYFYLVFSLFLAATPQTRFVGITAVFGTAVLLGATFPSSNQYVGILTNPLVLEFLLGCALAHLYRTGIRLSNFTCFMLAAGAMALLALIAKMEITDSWLRIAFWGGPAAMLVYAAVLKPSRLIMHKKSFVSSSFEHMGNISYSLYLSHFFVLAVFVRVYAMLSEKLSIGPWLASLSLFAACIVAAHICYILIENPSRLAFKKWRRPPEILVTVRDLS
jgi:exopolysaccharide production protein ExoZ